MTDLKGFWTRLNPFSIVERDLTLEERLAIARGLPARGFIQTSAKYRMVARVPPGLTPIEALRLKSPWTAKEFEDRFQHSIAEQYARCYADGDDKLELTEEEFAEFKFMVRNGDR